MGHHLRGGRAATYAMPAVDAGPTDAELCERFRNADREAAGELVRRHRRLVVGIAKRLIPYDARFDLDDFIQVGMIGLLYAAGKYHAGRGTRFSTYAYPAVRWAMTDELNGFDDTPVEADLDRSRDTDDAGLDSFAAPAGAEPPDPDAHAVLFAGLTPHQEQLVRMAYGIDHEPLSQREIAKRLGVGRSTVRKRLTAALDLIRAALDGVGFDPAAEVAAAGGGCTA